MRDLKPCPFCGGEAVKIFIGNEYTKKRSVEIKCKKCRVKRVNAAIYHDHDWLVTEFENLFRGEMTYRKTS